MSLNRRQRHQLHRMEARMLRSDPKLVEMLGVFGRLSAGEVMPAREQMPARHQSIRQAAALIVKAITIVAAAIVLLFRAVLALVIAVAGPRHSRRRPAPGPERARRVREADG